MPMKQRLVSRSSPPSVLFQCGINESGTPKSENKFRPGREWTSGEYYSGRRIARTSRAANDARLAKALWEKSEELVSE